MLSRRYTHVRQTIAALGAMVVLVVVLLWLHANPSTAALIMVLLVLLLAARWQLRYAVGEALLGAVCYAYYFLPPLRHFAVHDPQNWVALGVFLIVAVVGSRLAQWARSETENALRRQREVNVLFTLSRTLVELKHGPAFLQEAMQMVHRLSGASAVLLYLLDGDRVVEVGTSAFSALRVEDLRAAVTQTPTGPFRPDSERVALRGPNGARGVLIVRDARLSAESVHALGGLVSFATERY